MALHGAGRLAQWVSPRQLCGEGFEWMISLSLKVLVWAGLSQEGMLAARATKFWVTLVLPCLLCVTGLTWGGGSSSPQLLESLP